MSHTQTLNEIKGLIMDGVGKPKSGHVGGAFSSLDFAYLLFTEYLNFNPDDPNWHGRDRFVLSGGHESMLIYSLLHLIGWLSMDDLKAFRQLHSRTPGHPENHLTPGVECTTGPLGQGVAMSVGMAIAAKHQGAALDSELFRSKVFAICGDGDLQEDVALGAASLAGHLQLNNLVWYYDRNFQQISGPISRASRDNFEDIFRGFGWNVSTINGHDHAAIRKALNSAVASSDAPTIIIGETKIGHGLATMEGQHKSHGTIPDDEKVKTKAKLGLPADKEFYISAEAKADFTKNFPALKHRAKAWNDSLDQKKKADAAFAKKWHDFYETKSYDHLPRVTWPEGKAIATRNAFGDVIEQWSQLLPGLIGGSADLEPSNMTGAFAKKVGDFGGKTPIGRNLNFGVREFPMAAIANGIALHGGMIPFTATFLSFADYSRPALRLGAIQKIRVIHEFSHDSFYLGEDGPTHQPVEHIMSLRLIPDFYVLRPADANETEIMVRQSLALEYPSAICLSRQNLPLLALTPEQRTNAAKGAYVLEDAPAGSDLLIIATGSEVALASATIKKHGLKARLVSMPSWELFLKQPQSYRDLVLPASYTKRVSLEAGSTRGWQEFVGSTGLMIGLDHFGASAPMEALAEEFGFTPDKVARRIKEHFRL